MPSEQFERLLELTLTATAAIVVVQNARHGRELRARECGEPDCRAERARVQHFMLYGDDSDEPGHTHAMHLLTEKERTIRDATD